MSGTESKGVLGWTAAVVIAVLLGLAIPFLPTRVVLTVLVLAFGGAMLIVARSVLRSGGARSFDKLSTGTDRAGPDDALIRGARVLFYAGSALVGLITIRPAVGLTASDLLFFCSLGTVALAVVMAGLRFDYLLPRALTIGIFLFSFGGVLSSLGAVAPGQSIGIVVRLVYITLVWFWLATVVLRTRRHIQIAMLLWVASAAVSASGAIAQFFFGDVIEGGAIRFGRMTGFTDHFNNLGGLVATAFVPALMLAVDSPTRLTRLVAGACVGLLGAGLLLSASVGGLLATTVAVLFWLAVRGLTVRALLIFGAVFATGAMLLGATGSTDAQSPFERVSRVTSKDLAAQGTGGSIYSRFDGYGEAWDRILDNPVVGVGLDIESGEVYLGTTAVHNILLNPWFSAGIFGLVGIMFLIGGALVTGARAVRAADDADFSFDAALLASVVAFGQFALGEPILFVRYGWFPTALLVALAAQRRRAAVAIPLSLHIGVARPQSAASASH